MKKLFTTALCLLLVPLIGLWIGQSVEARYESEFISVSAKHFGMAEQLIRSSGTTLSKLCLKRGAEFGEICANIDEIRFLQQLSFWTFIAGISFIATVRLLRYIVGESRRWLAAIFNPIANISLVFATTSILAQSVILVCGYYTWEVAFRGRYYPLLIGVIALGALIAVFALIRTTLSVFWYKPPNVAAEKLTAEGAPGLFSLIDELAKKLGARKPDNVIVGLEPNFYITAAAVQPTADNKPLTGITLYISLPFLNIFSRNELSSVIGHELGHFKGEDTAYSLRFYPAYSKLFRAIGTFRQKADSESFSAIFALPAVQVLSFVLEEFGLIERKIGRCRELEADKAGANAANSESLISALMKVSGHSCIWPGLRKLNIEKLAEGIIHRDLAGLYCATSEARFSEILPFAISEHSSSFLIPHPTDTHPTIGERMAELGVKSADITPEILKSSQTPFAEYLADYRLLSERVSILEHRLMAAIGQVVLPSNIHSRDQP